MKVYDRIEKQERELTVKELMQLMAEGNRQVDLTFSEEQGDEFGFMKYDAQNWSSADGKRFICTFSYKGRVLNEYNTFNKYDMMDSFLPESAAAVVLN